ncbi:hypothetical protein FALBO_11852 [Fusarium albosuccineum]|uniref:Uncharacterized protein n=1 Tax=Fusarium albosuccineum TaxID=1237068 RepID=A0A8H4L3I8_9HYPO|nr:hypothetical protein FALBO_11852 [Fusarium albosuccineum]
MSQQTCPYVVQSRTHIYDAPGLSVSDCRDLLSLTEQYILSRPRPPNPRDPRVSARYLRDFYDDIFEEWNTHLSCVPLPRPHNGPFIASSVMVGTFKERGPHGYWDAGDIAFLRVFIELQNGQKKLHYVFQTKDNVGATLADIELELGLTLDVAIQRAIYHYDKENRRHVYQYNRSVLVALARRRLLKSRALKMWPGWSEGDERFEGLITPDSAWDVFRSQISTLQSRTQHCAVAQAVKPPESRKVASLLAESGAKIGAEFYVTSDQVSSKCPSMSK